LKKVFVPLVSLLLFISLLVVSCTSSPSNSVAPTTSKPATSAPPSAPSTSASPTPATTSAPAAPATSAPATTAASSTGTPKKGGVFKFADPRGPSTTLGFFAEAGAQGGMWTPPVLETFMECDVNGNFNPMLATKWEVASDLKSVTITLRKGVKFHDGSDFNATVAKWNLDQMINAKVSVNYTNISSIDVVDDSTIRLNLSKYQNSVLNTLAATYMTSKAAFDAKGKDGTRWNPVGTGPFKFVSYQQDTSAKYARFDNYWQQGKPYLDGVEMYFVVEPQTMSMGFQGGQYDAFGGDLSSVHYELQQKGFPIVKVNAGAYCLVPDSKNTDSPLSKAQVRLAVDYAVDRNSIVKARGFGFWSPIYQFANPGTPSYITTLQERAYNVAKAKQLLADAGYPSGFKTSIFADAASSDRDAVTAIQANLKDVGIDAEVQMLNFTQYGNYRTTGWKNGMLAGMVGFDANLNNSIDRYFAQTSPMFPSIAKTDEMQSLHLASLAARDFSPTAMQKEILYMYDNALVLPLWAGARGDVIKPFVKDSGFYTQQTWPGWKPYQTWLDK
jgi:peptide/nickel transport system substrate-binding protein